MASQRNGLLRLFEQVYGCFVVLGNAFQHVLLLIFRISWGWQFFITGKGKLANHDHVASFFASLGIPEPSLNAWFVAGLECVGGFLLMLGFASRPIALFLTINMIVAYMAVEEDRAKVLSIFKDPTPFLTADPFFFLLTALLVFCFGPGLISIDGIISRILAARSQQVQHKHAPPAEHGSSKVTPS
jgi:putative oxidoreductase